MAVRRRRPQAIGRLAVRRGLVSEEKLKACTPDGEDDPDLSSIIVAGHMTHRQLDELRREADAEEPAEPADRAEPVAGAEFGKYVILKQIGRGGMGTVWLASDPTLDRFTALKFLIESSPGDFQRFKREARMAASLSHPNIAAVYEFAMHNDAAYIAMQFVDGRTLAKAKLTPAAAARHMRQAAVAIDFAHRKEIIHRDLKPANLMVDREGHLFVMDFGLAKPLPGLLPDGRRQKEAGTLGVEGNIVFGTPGYMAPEQISGRIDARCDVYGLGATLYAILGGRPPFQATSIAAVMKQVMTRTPVPLKRIKPDVPGDLEAIVMRCLQKEKARRYPSARALADDLDRFVQGLPVKALPPTMTYRVRKNIQRNRRPWLIGAAVAALLALAAAAFVMWPRAAPRVAEHVARAEAAVGRGDLDAAEREYRAALALDADSAAARAGLQLLDRKRLDARIAAIEAAARDGRKQEAANLLAEARRAGLPDAQAEGLRRLIEDTRVVDVPRAPAWPVEVFSAERRRVAGIDAPGRFTLAPGVYEVRCADLTIPLRIDSGGVESTKLGLPARLRPGMAFVPTPESVAVGFWIDRREATNREYLEFVRAHAGGKPVRYLYYADGWARTDDPFKPEAADLPLKGLDDAQAVQYLLWRGLRLPSRAEWLRAGRGIDARTFPWGDDAAVIAKLDAATGTLDADVSPYGVRGLVSGPWEPLSTGEKSDSKQILFWDLGWAGGRRADYRELFRLDSTLYEAGSTGGGVRGAWTELPPEILGDAAMLRKLLEHDDAGVRAAALEALAAAAPQELNADLQRAVWDDSPFVVARAIAALRARGTPVMPAAAGVELPIWRYYLEERPAEIARRYLKSVDELDHRDRVFAPAALLYLGILRIESEGTLVLPLAEARLSTRNYPLVEDLYLRGMNSPELDLNAELGRWLASAQARHQWAGANVLLQILPADGDEAARGAYAVRYDVVARLPRLRELLASDVDYVREAAGELIAALEKAGIE